MTTKELGDILFNTVTDILKKNANLTDDIVKLRRETEEAVNVAIEDFIRTKYHIVEFNSPMGQDSCELLKTLDFVCSWKGRYGTRGTTYLYLPVDKYAEDELKDIREIFFVLSKAGNANEHYAKLADIFDENTTLTMMPGSIQTPEQQEGE